ncbi:MULTISPECIES: iron donor protein CyaY [unclassified Variovorax]|uniref:iron donor protein CyaY n=1 Tax=unclassified Variovorax TaxID=663243 RepID=UPI003F4899FF
MTDIEYMDRAEAALSAIERGCDGINDASEVDLDNQRVGGMITISFENGSQLIVNLQKPLQEIWLAARSGGYHYRHDGLAWVDTKTGEEFFGNLSREATLQAGQPLAFAAA